MIGSDKAYSFVLEGRSECFFVCESAIDVLSHATLDNDMAGKNQTVHAAEAGTKNCCKSG